MRTLTNGGALFFPTLRFFVYSDSKMNTQANPLALASLVSQIRACCDDAYKVASFAWDLSEYALHCDEGVDPDQVWEAAGLCRVLDRKGPAASLAAAAFDKAAECTSINARTLAVLPGDTREMVKRILTWEDAFQMLAAACRS